MDSSGGAMNEHIDTANDTYRKPIIGNCHNIYAIITRISFILVFALALIICLTPHISVKATDSPVIEAEKKLLKPGQKLKLSISN